MSNVVDRLETVYSVTDKYTGAVNRMARATSQFGSHVLNVTSLFGAFAAAGVGGGLIKFAVDSAMEFDTARRRLEAFTGSAKEAARLTDFIQQLAGPSLFEFKDLAKAGGLLAAYGLNVQKVLPLADQLASAFGDSGEAVSEVARVFGRLKAGDFGEAFERLRDFGISSDDLRDKGLKFSKSNEFLGTRLEALAAVSSIIQERFGKISEVMKESPAAKFASLMDSLRQSAAKVGTVILTAVTPALETVTSVFQYLSSSGIIEKIAKRFMMLFSFGDVRSALTRGILYIVAVLKQMPMAITRIRGIFEQAFASIATVIKPVLAFMLALRAAPMIAGIIKIVGVMWELAKVIRAVGIAGAIAQAGSSPAKIAATVAAIAAVAGAAAFAFDSAVGDLGSKIGQLAGGFDPGDLNKDVSRMMNDLQQQGQPGMLDAMIAAGQQAAFSALGRDDALADPLKNIEANTRATADNTNRIDFKRFALGGGDIAGMGIQAIDRFRGRSLDRNRSITINAGKDKLSQAVAEIARQVYEQADLQTNGGR